MTLDEISWTFNFQCYDQKLIPSNNIFLMNANSDFFSFENELFTISFLPFSSPFNSNANLVSTQT